MKLLRLIFICHLLFCSKIFSLQSIQETKGYAFIKQILVYEGVTDSTELLAYKEKYNTLLHTLLEKINIEDGIYDLNETIFEYLHENYLIKYEEEIRLKEIFNKKFYNCTSGTILFYAICQDIGLNVKIVANPYHVFLKALDGKKTINIDITDPENGYNYEDEADKKSNVNLLLKSKQITEEELQSRGIDSLYQEYFTDVTEITPVNLIQIAIGNHAVELIQINEFENSFRQIECALALDPKFYITQNNYSVIWAKAITEFGRRNDLPGVESLLLKALVFEEFTSEFKTMLLPVAYHLINNYISIYKSIEDIDSLFIKLVKAVGTDSLLQPEIISIKNNIDFYRVYDLQKKGYALDGFILAKNLYSSYEDDKSKDIYLNAALNYCSYLIQNEEFELALPIADTLIIKFNDYPIVQDLYISLILQCVIYGRLYLKNPEKAEALLNKVCTILPNNPKSKKAMTTLYHEYAMAMVRKGDYESALKMIEKGLTFDLDDRFLMSDKELIFEQMKKSKRSNKK